MNKLMNGTEYIQTNEGLLEVTFKREPKKRETDCDVCNLGEGKYCRNCDYQSLLPD